DQVPAAEPTGDVQTVRNSDIAFVRQIERAVPPGTMIFQLPHLTFPECAPVERIPDTYDFLRGYLHSTTLRWSHGAMRGRYAGTWQSAVARLPLDRQLRRLVLAGFGGLWVDRLGYKDSAGEIERPLACLLQQEPIVSDDERFLFFSLADFAARLRRQYSTARW